MRIPVEGFKELESLGAIDLIHSHHPTHDRLVIKVPINLSSDNIQKILVKSKNLTGYKTMMVIPLNQRPPASIVGNVFFVDQENPRLFVDNGIDWVESSASEDWSIFVESCSVILGVKSG